MEQTTKLNTLLPTRTRTTRATTNTNISVLGNVIKFRQEWIWSHLQKKSLMDSIIFCAVEADTKRFSKTVLVIQLSGSLEVILITRFVYRKKHIKKIYFSYFSLKNILFLRLSTKCSVCARSSDCCSLNSISSISIKSRIMRNCIFPPFPVLKLLPAK